MISPLHPAPFQFCRPNDPHCLFADYGGEAVALARPHFEVAGFKTLLAEDAPVAQRVARDQDLSLIVIALLKRSDEAWDLLRAFRNDSRTAGIPVIVLTSQFAQEDQIRALELGAEDCLAKPFSPRELVLRAQGILRSKDRSAVATNLLETGNLRLDRARHEIRVGDRSVGLTAIEFKLLSALMAGAGRVQTRDRLLNGVWGVEHDVEHRTVDTHVRRLRDKLGPVGEQIRTVRNVGYRLDDE